MLAAQASTPRPGAAAPLLVKTSKRSMSQTVRGLASHPWHDLDIGKQGEQRRSACRGCPQGGAPERAEAACVYWGQPEAGGGARAACCSCPAPATFAQPPSTGPSQSPPSALCLYAAPEILNAVIEIPRGSKVKYELDKKTGLLHIGERAGR